VDRITEKQVELFFRYGGDPDGLARAGTPEEKAAVSSAAWFAIMELAQAAAQSKRQLLDADAQRALADSLRERCADESAARKLIALA
jgi:hypothetical protein